MPHGTALEATQSETQASIHQALLITSFAYAGKMTGTGVRCWACDSTIAIVRYTSHPENVLAANIIAEAANDAQEAAPDFDPLASDYHLIAPNYADVIREWLVIPRLPTQDKSHYRAKYWNHLSMRGARPRPDEKPTDTITLKCSDCGESQIKMRYVRLFEAAYDALLQWALTDPWFRDVLVQANREDDPYTAMLYRDNDKKPSFRMRKP